MRDPWPKGQKDKSYFLGVSEYLLSLLSNSPEDGYKTKVPDFCPNWVWPEVRSARDKRVGSVPARVEVKSAFVQDGPGTPAAGTKGQVFCAGQNLTSPPTHHCNCGPGCFCPGKSARPYPFSVFVQPCRGGGNVRIIKRLCDASLLCGLVVAWRTLPPGVGGRLPLPQEANRMECQMTASVWTLPGRSFLGDLSPLRWVRFFRSFPVS